MAAAIPAILYYTVIFVTVHLEAKKLRLATMQKVDLPSPWPIIRKQGYLALPLVLIVVTLVLGYSIVFVAIVIILTTFGLALLQRTNRMTPVRLADAIEQTARATGGLSATAAAAGIIIGCDLRDGPELPDQPGRGRVLGRSDLDLARDRGADGPDHGHGDDGGRGLHHAGRDGHSES